MHAVGKTIVEVLYVKHNIICLSIIAIITEKKITSNNQIPQYHCQHVLVAVVYSMPTLAAHNQGESRLLGGCKCSHFHLYLLALGSADLAGLLEL